MTSTLLEPSRHDVYPYIDPRGRLKGAASGKIVLITGAGSGIGRSISESFALAGAALVILVARRVEPLEETKHRITKLVPECEVAVMGDVDISDPQSVQRLFNNLPKLPDVLISNAAVNTEWKLVHDSGLDAWKQNLDVNLLGTYYMAKTYLDTLRIVGRTDGRIVNVSSSSSWRYVPGLSSYAVSKAGVNVLSEYIDREKQVPGTNIRCVAMHPGGVLTGLGGEKSDEIKKVLIDQPALAGGTAVFLSTEESNFLMGRYVDATWDMEELSKLKGRVEDDDNVLRERVVGRS